MPIELFMRAVGPWTMNAYAFVCAETRASVLIDPGADADVLQEMLRGTTPRAIILTHTHFDHRGALDEMRARLNVPVLLHRGPHAEDFTINADRWLADGDPIELGKQRLRIYATPGHTADQICIAAEGDPRIVVGDTIFDGGPGKTWSPEDFQTTRRILRDVILRWSDETMCYPGHGAAFRLGDRRRAIENFLSKDHGAFFGDATWEM